VTFHLIFPILTIFAKDTVEARVVRARDGDSEAREDLIRDYTPFILKTASSAVKRYLSMGRDEEVSIALMAFDEAINAYTSRRPGFLAFAATVIRRRLIDYFRREKRRTTVPFSAITGEDSDEWVADNEALENYVAEEGWETLLERRDEIERWKEMLGHYKLKISDVVKRTPKHQDARERAQRIAALVARNPDIREEFLEKRKLPIRSILDALPPEEQVSKKTLERQKDYITAVALILAQDFPSIKEFLDV
jgi:RNA polymerase sigma factor